MSVRAALLQLLDEGERHGYQLKVDFEERTGGIWALNVGQVYTTLERLARDGCVVETEVGEGGQRTFGITDGGRRELKSWLATSPVDSGPPRDELIMKVLLAMGRGGADALAVVDEQRSALLVALQAGRRLQRARSGEELAQVAERLAHDAVLTRLEADVTWLDRCEEAMRATVPTRRER